MFAVTSAGERWTARRSHKVVGLGDGETVLASDPQAIVELTRRVVYLDDREIAVISRDGVKVERLDGRKRTADVTVIDDDAYGVADLQGFPHFMLKEIHEQPESIQRCLRGRLQLDEGNAKLGGFQMDPRELVRIERIIALGCGTSYHAGMTGAMAIEALARVPARAEVARLRAERFAQPQQPDVAAALDALREQLAAVQRDVAWLRAREEARME